jgi:hypothetical protein
LIAVDGLSTDWAQLVLTADKNVPRTRMLARVILPPLALNKRKASATRRE